MKKALSLAIAAVIAASSSYIAPFSEFVSTVSAVETVSSDESITIDIGGLNERGFIEGNDFSVEVSIMQSTEKTKYYNIICEVGGVSYPSSQVVARPNINITKEIPITDAKQGPVEINVHVYENQRLAKELSTTTTVIVPYEEQFLEDYSNKGINGAAPEYQDYFDLMGLQNARLGDEWYWIENQQIGVYNWPVHYQQQIDAGQNILYLLVYGNPMYNGGQADKTGPTTKVELDGYVKFGLEVLEKYPEIEYFELWNEPNISFWLPTPNLIDYMNLVKVTSLALKQANPDLTIAGGSIAVNDYNWINDMYENNAFPYLDSLSVHPYGYPTVADEFLQAQLTSFDENVFKHGGWTENTSTEFGWPTHEGNRGITDEQQAIEAVKHYVITDYNDFTINQFYRMNDLAINGSHDETYNEDNFGIINYDGTPKPAVPAITELCRRTNGGQQLGKMDIEEGIEAYLYAKDKKPLLVLWKKTNAPENCPNSVTFDETVTAYDIYGNKIGTSNTVSIGESPVYVEGLSADTAAQAISYTIELKLDEKLAFLEEASKKSGYAQMREILYSGVDMAEMSSMPSEEEILTLLDNYYENVLGALVEQYRNGTFQGSIMDLTSMMYAAHLGGVRIMNLGMLAVPSDEEVDLSEAEQSLNEAQTFIDEKKGAGTLPYAEAIKTYARKYYLKLEEVSAGDDENPMRAGVLRMWSEMVKLLSGLSIEIAELEEVGHDNVLLLMPSSQYQFDIGTRKTSNMLMYNYSSEDISGVIEIVDPSGTVVGTSEQVNLAAGESAEIPVDVLLDTLYDENENYTMRFGKDGEYLVDTVAPIEVRTKVSVDIGLIETNFQGIKTIDIDVTNLIDEPVKGTVTITPPDGWSLQSNSMEFNVNQEQTTRVSFPVVQKTSAPYNYYAFGVELTDGSGKILYSNNLPLSFSVVPKADSEYDLETFDGDISSWANAYPIYLGLPKDVTSYEDWKNSNVAARVLTKWDDNYLYMLIDAFDNVHSQLKRGGEIWNGDCVQVSIDPNNDKADDKYTTEDYEYGFAYSDQGGNIAYSWYKPNGTPGEEPNTYSTMLRENETRLSRYLIKLPLSAIEPMKLEEGTQFGYNVVLNDADFTDRENFIEYVPGTGANKMPSLYPTYTLIASEPLPTSANLCPIPETMIASDVISDDNAQGAETYFDDIRNHWAAETIIEFAELGYVSGTGERKFEPDRSVTRAEFARMIMNVADLDASETSYFGDVAESAWYYDAANSVMDNGLLFDEMITDGFKPDIQITREEAIGMVGKYYLVNDKAKSRKALDPFGDSDKVSQWARTALEVAYAEGVLNGDDMGNINPQSSLTRAEAVTVLKNLTE